MKKFNLFKMLAVLIVLITSINTAWAGTPYIENPDITIDGTTKKASEVTAYHLGIKTSLAITNIKWYAKKNGGSDLWGEGKFAYGVSGTTSTSWTDITLYDGYWHDSYTTREVSQNINLQLCSDRDPGDYEIYFYFAHRISSSDYVYYSNSNNNYHVYWTIPGFTTTSTSNAFGSVNVGSNSSATISFTKHYGTALTTGNCSLTNSTDFSVTSISETGVTVTFAPQSTGAKSSTLTITDAHSKTCTITLSGTGIAASTATLTYHANYAASGTGSVPAAQTVALNASATVAGNTGSLAMDKYTFAGWNTEEDITGTDYAAGSSITMDDDKDLYAKWEYTVTLNQNGATTSGSTSFVGTWNCSTIPSITNPSRTGYNFYSWNTESNGSGSDVIDKDGNLQAGKYNWTRQSPSYTNQFQRNPGSKNKPLYAKWTAKTYSETGNLKETNSTSNGKYTATYDATTIAINTTPTKTGYHVEGYYTSSALTTKVANSSGALVASIDGWTNGSSQWKMDATVPLYIKWEANTYAVTLNPNGGSGSDQTVTATYDADMPGTLSGGGAITEPSKEGYTFGGYWRNSNGTGTKYYNANLTSATTWQRTSSTTLYAKWTQTVTLNANTDHHGSGDNTSATATYNGISSSLSGFSATSAATGYQVEGYYSDPTSGVKVLNSNGTYASDNVSGYIESGKWTHAGATTLYAHMTAKTYSITLNQNGSYQGNGSATATYMSNKLTISSAASRTGFDVLGYYKEVECTNLIADSEGNLEASTTYTDASGNWTSTSGQTLYAKWGMQVPATLTIDGQLTGGWDDRHSMAKDGRVYTYTVYDLPAGTYEFCFKTSGGSDYLKTNTSFCSSTKNAGNITWESSDDHDSENHHNFYITTGSTGFSDITITVTFGETKAVVKVDKTACSGSSSWYLIGDRYSTWDADKAKYRFNRSWRGMSGIYYRIENVDNNDKYFKLSTTSDRYGPSGSDQTVALNSKYTANKNTSESVGNKAYKGNVGWVWCVVDPRNGSNVQFWVENKTYYTLSTSSDHGTVTIKDNTYNLAATQYESGETVKISISAAEGYLIDDITIGGSSIAADVHATSYNGTTSMPANDATLTVTYVQSYTLNYSIGTVAGTDGMISSSPTTATGSLVIGGNTVTLTAPAEKTGYTWKGWYLNNDGSGVQQCETKAYAVTMNADKTLYACYTEDMHTVALGNDGHGHIEIGGATVTEVGGIGIATASGTITAVPDDGYYFVNWTGDFGDGITLSGGSSTTSASITINATEDSKVISANFAPDEKIYFDNTYSKWSNVYVYLFNDNTYWTNSKENGVHPKDHLPTGFAPVAMTKVAGTDNLYEYAYHTSSHNYSFSYVAFSEVDMQNYDVFGKDKHAVYRGDWHKNLPVYVATEGYERVQIDKDDAAGGGYGLYHSGGYWRVHNPKAKDIVHYYLDKFSGTATWPDGDQEFRASGDGSMVAEVQARLTDANTTYTFGVHSEAGGTNDQHYAEGTTITNENSDNYLKLYKYNSSWNISVKTTSEGIYTFVLSMEYDSLRFSVIYPASVGDYRLTYSYDSPAKTRSSDIIKKKVADTGDAIKTSMYVDPTNSYSELIVERCTAITDGKPVWTARKTFNHASVTSLFSSKGVYEMDITIAGTTGDASTLTNIAKYSGPFYIKTDCASGGWADYTKNVLEQNSINFDASDSKTYDYFFVKYIGEARKKYGTNGWDACNLFDNAGTPTNVKCVIANMYNNSISDTLKTDDVISGGSSYETLPIPGSVRFSYNSATNEVKRTYLNGSTCWEDQFLLITADQAIKTLDDKGIKNNDTTFADKNNWVYELRLKVPETTKIWLKATYNSTAQDLIGTTSSYQQLIGGDNASEYQFIRIIYDFKTNYIIAAWEPAQGTTYDAAINLASDVLLIHNRRTKTAAAAAVANGWASADECRIDSVTLVDLTTGGKFTEIGKVYSAMRFQKTSENNILGLKTNDAGSEATALTSAESYYRFNYWISFPYDVKMTDIFGIEGYGSKWRIQRYDGADRATRGWYKGDGTTTFWKTIPMSDSEKLNANEGYVLQLSPSAFRSSDMWVNSATERYLYFPSGSGINVIDYKASEIELIGNQCTLGLFTDPTQAALGYTHNITDSYWHVFGIPTFDEATGTVGSGTYLKDDGSDIYPESHAIGGDGVFYFYVYNNDGTTYNTYSATSSSGFTFQPMHAYMIQMNGKLSFTANAVPSASLAARRLPSNANYNIQIDLKNNNTVQDRTFVTLRESALEGFAFNEDMMKIYNTGKSNIYSYAGVYDVAANILPIENKTVSLGVETAANGLYTFSMPSEFSGSVVLIDTYTGARTNLALGDYEVNLTKGTLNDRFLLEINIHNAPTAIEGIEGGSLKDGKAHKFVQNGVMYILRDGKIYDARGAMVK